MARLAFAQAIERSLNQLLGILASGQNPDGSSFSLRVADGISDTLMAGGSVTAPGAGVALCTIASGSLPAGIYTVTAEVSVSGNAVADLGNVKLQRGGVDLVPILPQGAGGNTADLELERVTLDGTQSLALVAIGAGTAAIEYDVTLLATRVE
jgi:hypothetical protein